MYMCEANSTLYKRITVGWCGCLRRTVEVCNLIYIIRQTNRIVGDKLCEFLNRNPYQVGKFKSTFV